MQNSLRSLSSVISWPKLWDMARDRGIQGSRSLTVFLKVLTTPIFKDLICPFCNHVLTRDSIFVEHISTIHLSQPISHLISILENADEGHIFQLGSRLKPASLFYCAAHFIFVSLTGLTMNFELLTLAFARSSKTARNSFSMRASLASQTYFSACTHARMRSGRGKGEEKYVPQPGMLG